MSDSDSSSDTESVDRSTTNQRGSSGGAMRWLLVLNGVVCCALVLAWVVFGRRGGESANAHVATDTKPFATATDSTGDDDDNNGRPKVLKIEMKWSESGIADFQLTERSGRTICKEDLVGHPWVVSFIFTNCAGPCFRVTSAMRRLQDEFLKDSDLRLVTITVDPERDTPAQLAKYADGFEADPERWLFLTDPTGQRDKIYPLIQGSFLQRVEEAQGEMREPGYEIIHTNNVLLVDERGVVQGKWLSTYEAEFDQLRRELKKRFRKMSKDKTLQDEEGAKPE